jgi:hypothetical protein
MAPLPVATLLLYHYLDQGPGQFRAAEHLSLCACVQTDRQRPAGTADQMFSGRQYVQPALYRGKAVNTGTGTLETDSEPNPAALLEGEQSAYFPADVFARPSAKGIDGAATTAGGQFKTTCMDCLTKEAVDCAPQPLPQLSVQSQADYDPTASPPPLLLECAASTSVVFNC